MLQIAPLKLMGSRGLMDRALDLTARDEPHISMETEWGAY